MRLPDLGTYKARVLLTWEPAPAAVGYRIYRGSNDGGERLLHAVGNVLTFADTGLDTGDDFGRSR